MFEHNGTIRTEKMKHSTRIIVQRHSNDNLCKARNDQQPTKQKSCLRRSEQYENAALLSTHESLCHSHHNLQKHASESQKCCADYSNNRVLRAALIEDDDVRNNCNVEFQLKTLNLNYGDLEKFLGE